MAFLVLIILFIAALFIRKKLVAKDQEISKLIKLAETYRTKTNSEFDEKIKELSYKQKTLQQTQSELKDLESIVSERIDVAKSNLSAIPYMARIIADFDTRGLDYLAQQLNWGFDKKRLKKVKSILEIKRDTEELIAQYKEAEYQLAYAIQMFPALDDFLSTDYNQLSLPCFSDLSSESHDHVRDYLSEEEYSNLSSTERNQLALDRYRKSHQKSNWQIGRDYELYVGYRYSLKGYTVDYFGSYNGLNDLGRDLIAKKDNQTLIIQCKYWSSKKQIHEKHINQLYGTMVCYCFENNLPREYVHGVLVTNIAASDTAKQFADYLGIKIVENYSLGTYPCIKCNINRGQYGETTYIYHLPFDQQYDSCKIDSPGEFMAMTVAEAEKAGFRRAYRWHGG